MDRTQLLRRPGKTIRLLCVVTLLTGLGSIPVARAAVGALAFVEAHFDDTALDGPRSVAVSPDGHHVYVASLLDDAVVVFSRDAVTGALVFVESEQDGAGGVEGLDGARSVAVSPDGDHVYVAGYYDNALAVFSRDRATGALTYVETEQDGVGGVEGLYGAYSVAVSPDGEHVYVVGYGDAALAVFSRDEATGALTYVEVEKDGVGGVDGLDGAHSVAVSPDGDHVYVAGGNDSAVAVFSRDEGTGALTYVDMEQDGVGGVDGLWGAMSVAVSPDGDQVYVGGYLDNAVAVFSRDGATGTLSYVETEQDGVGGVDGLYGAMSVAVSPDGDHVYVAGYYDDAVAVFSRDPASGALVFVEMQQDGADGADGLDGAASVAISPDGGHVYVAGYRDDGVAVLDRGVMVGETTYVETQEDGVGGVDGLSGARSVAISPDGHHVYVAGIADNAVAVFSRDGATGALAYVEVQRDGIGGVDGLYGAYSVAVSPDGDHVYVAGWLDDAVAVFSRDGASGALTYVEVHKDGIGGVDGLNGAMSVTVSPDGDHVYVAGSYDDAVAVFSRDGASGALTCVEMQQDGVGGVDGLDGAQWVAVSPDGGHVYATAEHDDAVAVFSRDGATGALTYVEMEQDGVGGVDGLNGASSVAVSPDGDHVYAAGYTDDAVAVFSRDSVSGALTYVEMQQDGVGGVDGLYLAASITVSPDGDHVYVAGRGDDAVVVFSREGTTGGLTYVEMQRDGTGGVDGLYGASSVAVSPDGHHVYIAGTADDAVAVFSRNRQAGGLAFARTHWKAYGLANAASVGVSPDGHHVYVAAEGDDAVALFSRDPVTGGLVFVEMEQDGVGGVDGLDAARSVALSPDGDHVYVAGKGDDAVAVFSRDGASGALTYVEMQQDGVGGVDGLDGAWSVALSPDGDHVYVAGSYDDAVAVFSRDGASGALTYVEMQQDGVGGVDGLLGAYSVAVSPDGDHVYTAAAFDHAVAVFSRDEATGALTYVEVERDGVGGADGLRGAGCVAVSPDGDHVYAAAGVDDAVAAFSRDEATGELTYVEMEQDGVGGADGLDGATSVALSPDGDYVYVAGYWDHAVAVFARHVFRVYLPLVLR